MADPVSRDSPGRALEEMILGGPVTYTQAEISEKSGVPPEFGRRIWQAMGFPAPPEDAVAFTEQDAQALQDIRTLLANELVDEGMILHLARGVGQTMGRLASWVGGVWLQRVLESLPQEATVDAKVPKDTVDVKVAEDTVDVKVAEAIAGTGELLPVLGRVLLQGWRRQLAAAAVRAVDNTAASIADPETGTAQLAVGFADIVSFTSLSRQLDAEGLATLIERFEVAATEICADLGGRIVKSLGDEVLFYSDDPQALVEIGLRLAERSERDEGFPRLRVGLAYGEVVTRLGDVFGTPVNMAARLTAVALPSSVLADPTLAAMVGEPYWAVRLKPRQLQGLGRIRPWALRRDRPQRHR